MGMSMSCQGWVSRGYYCIKKLPRVKQAFSYVYRVCGLRTLVILEGKRSFQSPVSRASGGKMKTGITC